MIRVINLFINLDDKPRLFRRNLGQTRVKPGSNLGLTEFWSRFGFLRTFEQPNSRFKLVSKPMFFSGFNYRLIGIAILLIVVGFTAMLLEKEVKGVISLYVSPIVIMAGYVIVIFAIMKHDRIDTNSETTS